MRFEVDPVLHKYVLPPDTVKTAVCPMHIVVSLDMIAVGEGFAVMRTDAVSKQATLDTVTI